MSPLIHTLHGVLAAALALFALHRIALVLLRRGQAPTTQPRETPGPLDAPARFPFVTVQLPLYNEANVAERLLEAASRLEWPRDRLEIQVLDDSTDDTAAICARVIARLRARGVDAVHVRRPDRRGFKAGALAHGLLSARGELVLVLDADFVPPPDLLPRATAPFSDPRVGCVQARWGHLNPEESPLTRAQAMILDAHFAVEQLARSSAGRFFNFNGTAGVWRRAAIEDAGGWQADTLTEDTDLSYRAQLRGWRFVYLRDVVAPAELPRAISAFKSQQFRWAKGQTQVARKLLGPIWRARVPLAVKLEATLHLTGNLAYPLLLALCLLAPFAPSSRAHAAIALAVLGGHALFYLAGSPTLRAARRLPLVFGVCAGLCINQARAVLEALAGRASEFVRTPKQGDGSPRRRYRVATGLAPWLELGLAAYTGVAATLAIRAGAPLSASFLLLVSLGCAGVGLASLRDRRL